MNLDRIIKEERLLKEPKEKIVEHYQKKCKILGIAFLVLLAVLYIGIIVGVMTHGRVTSNIKIEKNNDILALSKKLCGTNNHFQTKIKDEVIMIECYDGTIKVNKE